MKDIITQLEAEGLGPEQCSSEEVVRVLFTRQKELSKKLKEADDVLTSCNNGDPRPVILVCHIQRPILLRYIRILNCSVLMPLLTPALAQRHILNKLIFPGLSRKIVL